MMSQVRGACPRTLAARARWLQVTLAEPSRDDFDRLVNSGRWQGVAFIRDFITSGDHVQAGWEYFSRWSRLPSLCACIVFFIVLSAAGQAANPKRVLIIHSFGRDFEPYGTVANTFRTELVRGSPDTIVLYEATLDAGQKVSEQEARTFLDYLRARFAGNAPDLVVTIGPPAAGFYIDNREQLFSSTPLVAAASDQRIARASALRPGDAVVAGKIDFPLLLDEFLEVFPDTRTIAIVFGASPLERFWIGELKRELDRFNSRVELRWLNDLTLEQTKARVAALPPQSAVFLGLFIVDAAGVPHDRAEVLASLHAVANAPIFGLYQTDLGKGTVGGSYSSQRRHGRQIAEVALGILGGLGHADTQLVVTEFSRPTYDWRELHRWNADLDLLPPKSRVRFKPPTLWEEHRVAIVAVVSALLVQTALIAALLWQRMGRRRAEREAQSLGGRLITAHEDERRRLARELHDDITQRLAGLAIDAGMMTGEDNSARRQAARDIRDGIVELSEDIHALSHQLHPSIIEDLGLVEALRAECDRVSRQEAIRVDLDAQAIPAKLPPDKAICLFRVAQEALRNVVRHAGASRVDVSLQHRDGGIALGVRDNGAGFDDSRKHTRASLGLASMRERVRLQSGRIDIESREGHGTAVNAWIPFQEPV